MPAKKHHIKLNSEERGELESVSRNRRAAAIKVRRARAILAMDSGEEGPCASDTQAATLSGIPRRSLERLRKRVCEVGPLGALEGKRRESPPVPPKVTGDVEARIVQIACSEPPDGLPRWSMQMIADRLVELEIVESISNETVRLTLKKTTSNHGSRTAGASHRRATPPS